MSSATIDPPRDEDYGPNVWAGNPDTDKFWAHEERNLDHADGLIHAVALLWSEALARVMK